MATQVTRHFCTNCKTGCTEDDLYCRHCGCVLLHALRNDDAFLFATEKLGITESTPAAIQWGTRYFHPRARLYLQMEKTNTFIPVKFVNNLAVIGRRGGSAIPHVDLTGYDALGLGVSRYHLRIAHQYDAIYVTDLNSLNGTFMDRERLKPEVPTLLHNKAILQLGTMLLRAHFS
jgi:pSer/pThr/pTyr-binding forkhead associated (FHA) protein